MPTVSVMARKAELGMGWTGRWNLRADYRARSQRRFCVHPSLSLFDRTRTEHETIAGQTSSAVLLKPLGSSL